MASGDEWGGGGGAVAGLELEGKKGPGGGILTDLLNVDTNKKTMCH